MNGTKKCSTQPAASPLIEVTGVGMEHNGKRVLADVNLTINRGDFYAITGPNGGGKTTLMRIILGLIKPTSGSVKILQPGLKIGYLPQKSRVDSRFPISVTEVISSGLLAMPELGRAERRERTLEMLELVGLTEHQSKAFGALSGGQQQRALLARAIISRPQLLVLDEPLSYVDKHFEQKIYEIISELSRDTTILLVSHEMTAISRMANHHLLIDRSVTMV
ncbi:MAG: ATP-binding cassette domain-containing protein [Bacteroides sp.]|nr:ATP-binding cassette domain-containing protein [Bacteroides sp.]